jgi:bifunctional enzyme CysN/CysC/sulfate adenylyltransferase subunit 1
MDLVGWSAEAYRRAADALADFARRLTFESLHLVPVAATIGDNVARRGESTPWYQGPTILELLETLPVQRDREREPFRLPVQTVLRPDHTYRAFAGQIASGSVAVGDEVVVLPSRRRSRVKGIDVFDGSLTHAYAPMSVAIRLADEVDASRGETLCKVGAEPDVATAVEAGLVWLSERPFDPQRKLLLKHGSRVVPARVAQIVGRRSLETLELDAATGLSLNDIATVRIEVTRPIFCDAYVSVRGTGAFILVDAMSNGTIAAGMIERAVETRNEGRGPVTPDERAIRMGHAGAVVVLGARPSDAAAVERILFDGGLSTLLVRAGELEATALVEVAIRAAAAGLVVLVEGAAGDWVERIGGRALVVRAEGVAPEELAAPLGASLAVGQRP